MPSVVLIIEDDPLLMQLLSRIMLEEGDGVIEHTTAAAGREAALRERYDVVILDWMLPDGDGIDCIRGFRGWSSVPVIVLSARVDETDKIAALDAGADDYLTKPFGVGELLARVRATRRRQLAREGGDDAVFRFDDVEVDQANRIVRKGGAVQHLTPIEYDLLRVLARNRGRLMTHRALLTEVWGPAYVEDMRTLRTHIANLRHKIEPPGEGGPRYIRTDPGVGYRFTG